MIKSEYSDNNYEGFCPLDLPKWRSYIVYRINDVRFKQGMYLYELRVDGEVVFCFQAVLKCSISRLLCHIYFSKFRSAKKFELSRGDVT